jgi:hypothetical protein
VALQSLAPFGDAPGAQALLELGERLFGSVPAVPA